MNEITNWIEIQSPQQQLSNNNSNNLTSHETTIDDKFFINVADEFSENDVRELNKIFGELVAMTKEKETPMNNDIILLENECNQHCFIQNNDPMIGSNVFSDLLSF
jgi:hypothetical protein